MLQKNHLHSSNKVATVKEMKNSVLARNVRNLQANHGLLLSSPSSTSTTNTEVHIEMRQPWDRGMHYPHWPCQELHMQVHKWDPGCSLSGSHRQVTVHTWVVYTHGSKALPFCTISDSRPYDPFGICCQTSTCDSTVSVLHWWPNFIV